MADWQVGDLALCVDDRPNPTLGRRCPVMRGRVYSVKAVLPMGMNSLFGPTTGLKLDGVRTSAPSGAIASRRFIKVTPPAADEDDREVIALLTGKPVEVGA